MHLSSHLLAPPRSAPPRSAPLGSVENITSIQKYVYAYENNEFTDERAIALFDKVDYIFVDADRRLYPWGQQTRALQLLIKTAFFTNKCLFAAGAASQFVSFVLANGGKKINVINGPAGSPLSSMKQFVSPPIIQEVSGLPHPFYHIRNKTYPLSPSHSPRRTMYSSTVSLATFSSWMLDREPQLE